MSEDWKPRTVNDWKFVLDAIDWFYWLIGNHSPQQILKAMKAATHALAEIPEKNP